MYATACQSACYDFRATMIRIIEKATDPHPTRIQRGWSRLDFRQNGGHYFAIFADQVGNLTRDLERIRYYEELKLVRLFSFWGTRSKTMVTIGGRTITQDRWVYDEVVKVVGPERVAIMPRGANFSREDMGLPEGPRTYRILEQLAVPPRFVEKDASEFDGVYLRG